MQIGKQSGVLIQNASFRYRSDGPFVLSEFSLKAEWGDIVWLVGDNGSGKTTIGKLLAGEIRPTSGRLSIEGLSPHTIPVQRRWQTVFVVQQRSFLGFVRPTLRGELEVVATQRVAHREDLYFTRVLKGTSLTASANSNPLDLSFVQAWRAAVAVGVLLEPLVLVIDELPNLCGRRTIDALAFVIERRRMSGLITLITAHSAPPQKVPQTKLTYLTS